MHFLTPSALSAVKRISLQACMFFTQRSENIKYFLKSNINFCNVFNDKLFVITFN